MLYVVKSNKTQFCFLQNAFSFKINIEITPYAKKVKHHGLIKIANETSYDFLSKAYILYNEQSVRDFKNRKIVAFNLLVQN